MHDDSLYVRDAAMMRPTKDPFENFWNFFLKFDHISLRSHGSHAFENFVKKTSNMAWKFYESSQKT